MQSPPAESLSPDQTWRKGAPGAGDGLVQGEHRMVLVLKHLPRDVNRPHGETLQDAGQAVVVVDVGVREDHAVQAAAAARPKIAGNCPRGGVGRAHLPGVVEHRLSGRKLHHHRQAVSDGEKRAGHASAVGPVAESRGGKADGDPGGQRGHGPAPRRAESGKRGGRGQGRIKSDEPPVGRAGRPEMAPRGPLRQLDQQFDEPQTGVAHHAAEPGQRRGPTAQ